MCRLLLAAICCGCAHAAVIGGVVLDGSTGRPLARSLVTLKPVAGAAAKTLSVRANRGGEFTFSGVDGGFYLVSASRNGFAPFQYGQRDWKAAGKPMAVEPGGKLFLDIRLHRYGAISGTVLDENETGIPDQRVVAYRAKTPLEVAGGGLTDERGMYRIHGLEPDTYYVRTVAKELEDGSGLLPTFHKEVSALEQALTVEVNLDQEVEGIDVRPLPGKLVHVSGEVANVPPVAATVTLISDVGRVETRTSKAFRFDGVAPGQYELIAEGDDPYGHGRLGSYREMFVDKDLDDVRVQLTSLPETEFRLVDGNGNHIDAAKAKILARRKNLDGPSPTQDLTLVKDRATLGPGRWEIALIPPAGYYAAAFSGPGFADSERGRADGWNVVLLRYGQPVQIKLSSRPASIHGRVTGSGQDPVPGAPVYLEAFDQDARQRLTELRTTRSDIRGQYHFNGLAPGVYRILSSFEFEKPDSQAMEAAGARTVALSEGAENAQDLELYVR